MRQMRQFLGVWDKSERKVEAAKMRSQIAELLAQMTLEEKIALTIGRDFWTTNGVERLGIAPITLTDGPHGVRKAPSGGELGLGNSYAATCFPPAVSLAASWDVALAYEIGQALGKEAQALDVQVLLGPGINIKRTPLGGRNFEYFSEDPVLSGEMGAAWVNGVQSEGVGTSLKHYACNNQEWERMSIDVNIDERTLREIYLAAFERVIKKAQPYTIMAAYNKVNGHYAAEHPYLLNDILKNEWGFTGVVVSDWGAVNDKAAALEAGLDLEMPGPGPAQQTAKLVELVQTKQLSEAVIDQAAGRVLNMLLNGQAKRKADANFDLNAHHTLARRAAAESLVLLKNTDNLLPLIPEKLKSVAVSGQFAVKPRYQGAGSSLIVPTRLDNTLTELENWLSPAGIKVSYAEGYNDSEEVDTARLNEAVAQAREADVALVFVGLPPSFESEGFDRHHIFMPESHNRLIEEICRVQSNTIVILHNGSAVAMPWLAQAKALIEAGLGGQAVGGAIVDVLSGKVNPCGKLAETFPVRLEDTPAYLNYPGEAGTVRYGEGIFVGYRYYEKKKIAPLFPFGYGLSYTTFEYSDLKPAKTELQIGETLEVVVTVKNTGSRAGKEIVQLYVCPLNAPCVTVEELKAFAKIALEPGETGTVTLTLEARDFMYYNSESKSWQPAGNTFRLEVGGSSAALALFAEITFQPDQQTARRTFDRMTLIKHFQADVVANSALEAAIKGTVAEKWLSVGEMFSAMPIAKLVTFNLLAEDTLAAIINEANKGLA
jgi:beta-glucosidase